ncbi:MAG TPA: D-Ala-D-Ala carboxypeptidase family metallohydrolase [Mycobacterium sp.]|nr:D-Ala-D-Ala carboxypeptidase family metallohydrolase [Mycobacterium sp.]
MITSKYFGAIEFECHDGNAYPSEWHEDRLQPLVETLDAIREKWGSPIVVVSGYRTEVYNHKIGGAKLSQHVQGRAADVRPARGDDRAVRQLHSLVQTMLAGGLLPHLGGLGLYPRWIHVDVRPKPPTGHIAKWEGGGLGSEVAG